MEKDIGFSYSPTDPPRGASADDLLTWILQELENISNVVGNLAQGYCATVHKAPTRPRDGMIRKADGTDWNPGNGAGYYGFDEGSGTWKFLG